MLINVIFVKLYKDFRKILTVYEPFSHPKCL